MISTRRATVGRGAQKQEHEHNNKQEKTRVKEQADRHKRGITPKEKLNTKGQHARAETTR